MFDFSRFNTFNAIYAEEIDGKKKHLLKKIEMKKCAQVSNWIRSLMMMIVIFKKND